MNFATRNFVRGLFKFNRPIQAQIKDIDHVVCIDIECTCDSPVQINPQELIEIACMKVDLASKQPEDQNLNQMFHRYVRPIVNPELTLFCQELTGILQETVDEAEHTHRVLKDMLNWLQKQDLIDDYYRMKRNFAMASCGNFDLQTLNPMLTEIFNNEELPIYFKEWINVKKTFVYYKREWPSNLLNMLELLDEKPVGRLHSARDDCRNLAKVVERLHLDGCKFTVTSRL